MRAEGATGTPLHGGAVLLTETGEDQGAGVLSLWEDDGAVSATTELKCLWTSH